MEDQQHSTLECVTLRFVVEVFEHIHTDFVEHGPYCEADSRLPS